MLFEVVNVQSQYTSEATKNLRFARSLYSEGEILRSLRSLRMTFRLSEVVVLTGARDGPAHGEISDCQAGQDKPSGGQ
jgi:hypothetical protein